MLDSFMYLLGAFLLFLVGFPLAGLFVGFFLRVCTPYLAGPLLLVFALQAFDFYHVWWTVVFISLVWVLSIRVVRERLRRLQGDLHWSEGHFYGAFNVMTFAAPLRKGKTFVQRTMRADG